MAGRCRYAIVVVAIALLAGTLAVSREFEFLHGLSLDVLTALRWRAFGNKHEPLSSPAVVIALDQESYGASPFKGSPTVAWTREIGRVITAVVAGGASVVGFDVVFPTSIEESQVLFGSETFGAHNRGFDREFLRDLASSARAGKIVLGEVLGTTGTILPAAGQRVAVGQQLNIRAINVYADPDTVVRRVPLMLTTGENAVPGMALELASRATGVTPATNADQSVSLSGYRVPARAPNAMTINFDGGSGDIPTYSFADLYGCVERGNMEFFSRNFQGKVVLLGSTVDFEDRKLTSKRFANAPTKPQAERCTLSATPGDLTAKDTIDGVYIHATAVNNLLRRDAVTELDLVHYWIAATAGAGVGAFCAYVLSPCAAVSAFFGVSLLWAAGAVMAFNSAFAIPLVEAPFAGFLSLMLTMGFRLFVVEKDKRFLKRVFAFYLPPAVIKKMIASGEPPALGGEIRDVTVLCSDIVGFSSFSEKMSPSELVAAMNRYFSAMTAIIEEHNGFIDKFDGDAIVAIFGAPIEETSHAVKAVSAALQCCLKLAELNKDPGAHDQPAIQHRIGVNSGSALAGNIGSPRRFNYTVMGDVVNVAFRLESANKHFGTSILVSDTTMMRAGSVAFAWREVDMIRVKGRIQPVRVFEPVGEAGCQSHEQIACTQAYSEGLVRWRERDFAGAARSFAKAAADGDIPSALFLDRAKKFAQCPPADDWEVLNSLE
jgi:adenylate cyclase